MYLFRHASVSSTRAEAEMEKRVDIVDISVLIFLIAVLIFWLYTLFSTVFKAIS